MKNNKVTKYISIFVLLLILSGCKDKFLDVDPQGTTSELTYYDSFSKVDETVTATYSVLTTLLIFDIYNVAYFGSIASDDAEAGGESNTDQPPAHLIDRMLPTSSDLYYESFWGTCYDGLRMANTGLKYLNEMSTIDPDYLSEYPATVKQRIAECKFLRAFYHFQLSQVFGGVVIADKIIEASDYSTPRSTLKETYDFIISDLRTAIPDLVEKSVLVSNSEVGRASKGAAEALLAKVYLYESSFADNYSGTASNTNPFGSMVQHYDSAQIFAEEVINSNQYSLVGINGERFSSWRGDTIGGFRYIFTADADNGSELIWEVENVEDNLGYEKTRGNYMTIYTTCRYYRNKADLVALGTTSPFTSGNDESSGGWGFNNPSRLLIYAFANADSRETGLHSEALDSARAYLDPRFATTIAVPGDSLQVNDGDEGLGWYQFDFHNVATHTAGRKYECGYTEFWSNTSANGWQNSGPMDIRFIRYADVVLMAAEAAYKNGQTSNALSYVNLVRTRARKSGYTGYPKDLTAISFEDIMHERRLELALEGHRFFDLVRWGKAYDFINNTTLDSYPGSPVTFTKGVNELFPIPATEIQLTGIKQNYGY
jgi:starch-binding outer membrane protein, SusD/RagB family